MRRVSLPEHLAEAPFARGTALAAGVTPSRLRASDLAAPFHGVRQARELPTSTAWTCRAYLQRMTAGQTFSHLTAARLYNLPLPLYVAGDRDIHVSTNGQSRAASGRGVRGHELAVDLWDARSFVHFDTDHGDMFELPVVSTPLAWAQLATILDLEDLVAVGDAIVSGEHPLASLADLEEIVRRVTGRRGAKKLRRCLPMIRVGPRSRPESLQRLQIVSAGIPEPLLNVEVQDRRGNPIWMPDEVWPDQRLLVEYEGDGHRKSAAKFRRDITRFEDYVAGGWFAMRTHADDVFVDPNPFIRRLWRHLSSRGWQPTRSEPRQIAPARR